MHITSENECYFRDRDLGILEFIRPIINFYATLLCSPSNIDVSSY